MINGKLHTNMANIQRRRFEQTSVEDRERILNACNQGREVNKVCNVLGIKLNTAYKIINSGVLYNHMQKEVQET